MCPEGQDNSVRVLPASSEVVGHGNRHTGQTASRDVNVHPLLVAKAEREKVGGGEQSQRRTAAQEIQQQQQEQRASDKAQYR